jgi:hypothetical protein
VSNSEDIFPKIGIFSKNDIFGKITKLEGNKDPNKKI